MNNQNVLSLKKEILINLTKRQLKPAIDGLKQLSSNLDSSIYTSRIEGLETNYKYMLHYQFEDVNDPEQKNVYSNLIRSIFEMTDDISENLLLNESSALFFEKLRTSQYKEEAGMPSFTMQLKDLSGSLALTDLIEDKEKKLSQKKDLSIKIERVASDMFLSVFVSKRADDNTYFDYMDFMSNPDIREREKCLFISALMLNLFERFDAKKIKILMNHATHENPMISQRAIVGLIISMQMYDVRWEFYPECQQQLDALSENPSFRKSVLTIIKQLIRSRETEKISKKLNEEIIPEMMKFNSLAGKKLNMDELMGLTEDFSEKNPDWKKELEESGLANKLQEYSNLQMEGADVFHSTFSHLKSFPFFYEMGNWFLPFDTDYSELLDLFAKSDKDSVLYNAILNSGHMCNSDKYSFCLSLLQMPESQRNMMTQRFGAESEELKQLQKEAMALNPTINEEVISNQYIQDLYRFFKLHPSRNSFFDVFKLRINFYDKKSIAPLISDIADMRQIAIYCFDKNFLAEALKVYELIALQEQDDSSTWQKIGYCRQMLDNLSGALDAYLQADLIKPDNSWTIRRIAQLYRSEKKPDMALQYYLKLQTLVPENISVELNIGHCYLDLGEYEKALNTYFKVELLDGGDNTKAWRPIAWTALLLGKYDLSINYYQKILKNNPSANDFMNAGHLELILKHKKNALNYYQQALKMQNNNMQEFISAFLPDEEILISAGIEKEFFNLLFDELRYNL